MATILLLSIVVLQAALIAYPLIRRRFLSHVDVVHVADVQHLKRMIGWAANKMLYSGRIKMSFSDDDSLYALLSRVKNRILCKHSGYEYAYFNFPGAFLMLGAIDTYNKTRDIELWGGIQKMCGNLLDASGTLKFDFNKIDQAVFGLVFVRLYQIMGEEHYLGGAHQIYDQMQQFKSDDGLYRYRDGVDVFFVDTVGLVCPFLVEYSKVAGVTPAMADAVRQVEFALSCCIEPQRGLAYHAFDLKRRQPLGSVNWARGMGWLLLGLSAVDSASRHERIRVALNRSAAVLEELREEHGYWPQFVGHTNDRGIDSSATLMFLYAFQRSGIWTIDSGEIAKLASQCVDRRGQIVRSSGDTIYINRYSRVKGPSELSQGLMMSVIAGMSQ